MSSETEETEVPQFRPEDLPLVHIPLHLDLDSSDSEDEIESLPSTPSTPGTPITPLSNLAASVSSFDFGDILDAPTSSRSGQKRVYNKKYSNRFSKGIHSKRSLFQTPSKKPKRISLSRQSNFFEAMKFPKAPVAQNIILKEGDKLTTKQMFVPHGAEIMNMDVLSQVIALLKCPWSKCKGRLILHKLPFSAGLHSYFILHCNFCHAVVAQFSNSLNIGESLSDAVNNSKLIRRPSEISMRVLLAMHVTSMSWQDFLLTCALMDLPLPGQHINQQTMNHLIMATTTVTDKSMSLAASEVKQRPDTQPSNIPGASGVTSAMMPPGTNVAIIQIRVSERQSIQNQERFLISNSTREFVRNAHLGLLNVSRVIQRNIHNFGSYTKTNALPISPGQVKEWKVPPQWNYGSVQFRKITLSTRHT